jgi:four helix bundle protein
MAESIIRDKSYAFALMVIKLCQGLTQEKEYVLSRQLLKSGTSIGANVEEALAAQSRKDFISKMAIASKESRETIYWLRLLRDSGLADPAAASDLLTQAEALSRILTSIVKTTKESALAPSSGCGPSGGPSSPLSSNSKPKTHHS